jgi:hypothetical protein
MDYWDVRAQRALFGNGVYSLIVHVVHESAVYFEVA